MAEQELVNPADLTIETWPPRQIGGQQVGAGPTGVKITHEPTGIVVCVDVQRGLHRNKLIALDALAGALTSPFMKGSYYG